MLRRASVPQIPQKAFFREPQCHLNTSLITLPMSDPGRMLSLQEDEGDSDRH